MIVEKDSGQSNDSARKWIQKHSAIPPLRPVFQYPSSYYHPGTEGTLYHAINTRNDEIVHSNIPSIESLVEEAV